MPSSVLALVITASAASAQAQEKAVDPRATDQGAVDSARETPASPDRPLGWLSDPEKPPESLLEAIVSGKLSLDDRIRIEFADTTARDSSTAVTNRIRLGYGTKPFHGFSGYIEMENVVALDEDEYFVPPAGQGTPTRTVIADPTGTEVNRAFLRFETPSLGESDVSLDLKVGRQRIILDDARFIGNVGWRQFEQTYDAVSARTNLGGERLDLFYAYVWGVQRIFGPDGPNPDSDSHLIHVAWRFRPELTAIPFAHLLDFEGDDPINASNTFGLRLEGEAGRDPDEAEDRFLDYEFTLARQADAGDNPVDYEATFVAAELVAKQAGLGLVGGGYQYLGSDDGAIAFRFPLGTNHKFQGFADNFLTTPDIGLQDLYATVGFDLPWGVRSAATYHWFWSDEGSDDLGEEIDLVLTKRINPNWAFLVKAAFYDGDSGQPDTTRVWLQTDISF